MRESDKSTEERVNKVLRRERAPKRSPFEKEAADFFAHDGKDSVLERYAYLTASKRVLSRR
jgi:hypothetical protein